MGVILALCVLTGTIVLAGMRWRNLLPARPEDAGQGAARAVVIACLILSVGVIALLVGGVWVIVS